MFDEDPGVSADQEVHIDVEKGTHLVAVQTFCCGLQVTDVQGVQPTAQEVPIALKGEAYIIETQLRLPDAAATALDFGLMKATEEATKTVTLVNGGKYPVAFKFQSRGGLIREMFTIVPDVGSIAPGAQQAVELQFNKWVAKRRPWVPAACTPSA